MSPLSAGGGGPALARAAPVFWALGDPTRLGLMARLSAEGPLSIARLTEGFGVTRQAITKQLAVLAGAGLVSDERRGRERVWSLEPGSVAEARRCLDEIAGQWEGALERMRKYLED
ncbi:MAG TPA: metalloregulator ArsR/SmtB family transcription factor [Rectinemataceae bacterium]|nr:metalloregulator ArsR/SmtB family transcription factor [Rectinemataceae bacterium]